MNDISIDLSHKAEIIADASTGNSLDVRSQAEKLYNIANYLLIVAKNLELLACGSLLPTTLTVQRGKQETDGDVQLAARAVSVYQSRRSRESIFAEADLFGEPAWDIMLDLFIARAQRRETSVTSACVGSAVPSTTALRWIGVLESLGLLVREVDPHDRRRVFVSLSQKGYNKMVECLGHMQ